MFSDAASVSSEILTYNNTDSYNYNNVLLIKYDYQLRKYIFVIIVYFSLKKLVSIFNHA